MRVGREKEAAFGITCGSVDPNHCSRSAAVDAAEVGGRRQVPVRVESGLRPGNSPTIVPATREPRRKPTPAAPWSVPASPFSLRAARTPSRRARAPGRRDRAPRGRAGTRGASPRSAAAPGRGRRLVGVCVVFAGRRERDAVERQAGAEHGGKAASLCGNGSSDCGYGGAGRPFDDWKGISCLAQAVDLGRDVCRRCGSAGVRGLVSQGPIVSSILCSTSPQTRVL